MKINVHAGHNPDGGVGCGAVGLIKESTQNRVVKDKVISLLKARGHTVYDCTVDNGTSANDVLKKIVAKCNSHKVDLDVSIHFNAGAKKTKNGKTTGTEVYVYDKDGKAASTAKKICSAISALGFTNRGVVERKGLYVLKHTSAPALLIECCFVDDPDDVALYNATSMAEAIVYGITGKKVATVPYNVRVPGSTPVYEGARFDSNICMTIKNKGVYTIVEEKNGFGRLRSGAGWLNLHTVEKT